MNNRNIDESIRKPRRTRGTPSYHYRNYFALSVLAFGGICTYLYSLWPQQKIMRKNLLEGKFQFSPEEREKRNRLSLNPGGFSEALYAQKELDKINKENDILEMNETMR